MTDMTLVGEGYVVTMDPNRGIIANGGVVIQDGTIIDVGDYKELLKRYNCQHFIDTRGNVVMPGLSCSHHHLYSTFARGIPLKDYSPRNFREVLAKLWWKLDKSLKREDLYISSLIPLIECIKNGTTSIFDHHASPNSIEGSLFEIERAVHDAGIRASLCYEVSDRDGIDKAEEGIRENIAFLRYSKGLKGNRIIGHFGLHASFTLSDKTLEKCLQAVSDFDTGFHIHCAEDIVDQDDCMNKYGKRVVERLRDLNLLCDKTIVAHCIHISESEMDILKQFGAVCVYNPQSNMNNSVGAARLLKMLSKGLNLNLGTDGMTSNMLEEMRVGFLLQRHEERNPSSTFSEIPEILLESNPKFASRMFGLKLGKLIPGYTADIAVFDWTPATPFNQENFYGHLLYSLYGAKAVTTICGGKPLMYKGNLVNLDEEEIYARGRELAERLWKRI